MINKGFFFFFVLFLQRATGKEVKDGPLVIFFRRLINRLVAAIAVVGKHMKTAV